MTFISKVLFIIVFSIVGIDLFAAVESPDHEDLIAAFGPGLFSKAISPCSSDRESSGDRAATTTTGSELAGSGSESDDRLVGDGQLVSGPRAGDKRSRLPESPLAVRQSKSLELSPLRNRPQSPQVLGSPSGTPKVTNRFKKTQPVPPAMGRRDRCDSFESFMEEPDAGAAASAAPEPGAYTNADFLKDNPDFVWMRNDGVLCIRWHTEQDGVHFYSQERGHVDLSSLCGTKNTEALLASKAQQLLTDAVTLKASGSNIMTFAPVMPKFAHIENLDVYCSPEDDFLGILQALKPLRLKTLSISGGGAAGLVSGDILKHVNFEQLTQLSLWDITLGRTAVRYISQQPLLETLHLINGGLIDSDIHLLRGLTALRSLSLGGNRTTDREVNKLLTNLNPSLTYLDVEWGDDEGIPIRRLVERAAPQAVEGARNLFGF